MTIEELRTAISEFEGVDKSPRGIIYRHMRALAWRAAFKWAEQWHFCERPADYPAEYKEGMRLIEKLK